MLLRTVEILEEIGELAATMKADIIRSISLEDEKISRQIQRVAARIEWLCSLEFNQKSLFSQNGSDTSFKLFKDASPSAPSQSACGSPFPGASSGFG